MTILSPLLATQTPTNGRRCSCLTEPISPAESVGIGRRSRSIPTFFHHFGFCDVLCFGRVDLFDSHGNGGVSTWGFPLAGINDTEGSVAKDSGFKTLVIEEGGEIERFLRLECAWSSSSMDIKFTRPMFGR